MTTPGHLQMSQPLVAVPFDPGNGSTHIGVALARDRTGERWGVRVNGVIRGFKVAQNAMTSSAILVGAWTNGRSIKGSNNDQLNRYGHWRRGGGRSGEQHQPSSLIEAPRDNLNQSEPGTLMKPSIPGHLESSRLRYFRLGG